MSKEPSLKLKLQSISEWTTDIAKSVKDYTDVIWESGLLSDTIKELCDAGGVAGVVFKLGAKVIPDPDPEQRIACQLHESFLITLDGELKKRPDFISLKSWKQFIKSSKLNEVTADNLSGQFTWLSIFSSNGIINSRSWPIIGNLADIASVQLS
ncbi:MAG: hypothetical protein ACYC27_10250 [Armatimonadota bacterium]